MPPASPRPPLLRLWLTLVKRVVPREDRADWTREWLGECDVIARSQGDAAARRRALVGYAAGALPDALTVRAIGMLDGARRLCDGARLLAVEPVRHILAIAVLAVPIAGTVVMFQCGRASLASRPAGLDIGILSGVGLAMAVALTWAAARAASAFIDTPSVAASRTGAREAAAVILASSLAVPLIAFGLTRIGPTVFRAGSITAEAFGGDLATGLVWAGASLATWTLTRRRLPAFSRTSGDGHNA